MLIDRRHIMALAGGLAAGLSAGGEAAEAEAATVSREGLQAWNAYIDLLRPAEKLMDLTWSPDNELLRADLYRTVMMNLSFAYFMYFGADPEHPDFGPLWNNVYLDQPNPDDNYVIAPVRGDRSYRISGTRGTIKLLILAIVSNLEGMPGAVQGGNNSLYVNDVDSMGAVNSDGTFEIILSATRPTGSTGRWIPLDRSAKFVWFRQRSYDWGKEVEAQLAIECLDAPVAKTRMTAAEIDERLSGMLTFSQSFTKYWLDYQHKLQGTLPENKFHFAIFGINGQKHLDEATAGKRLSQAYWEAIFNVSDGDALLLETDLPDVRPYWNVQLNDPLFNALEYAYAQSSLNGFQARVDSDGKFRAVVSLVDPGVPNWLDTVGHRQGTIIGRWYKASSLPLPSLTRIPLSQVRDHLPRDTPFISPEERMAAIRKRARSLELRRRW